MCPKGLNRRAFTGADNAKVREGEVRGDRHLPAERVDFASQVSFRGATDAAIAGHVAYPVGAERYAGGCDAHTRAGQGCLDSGMP
jgi:hypothetical protein